MPGSPHEQVAAEVTPPPAAPARLSSPHVRATVSALVPGMLLPGLVYVVASRRLPVLESVVLAGAVPAVDALVRLLRGRGLNPASVLFALGAVVSAALALWSGSTQFVLMKGAVVSVALGAAFALSAAIGRPLTRSIAIRLAGGGRDGRRHLAARWSHPSVFDLFRALSLGWALLLVMQGAQQAVLAATASPGTVLVLGRPIQLAGTIAGIGLSVAYVRRRQRRQPELAVLTEPIA